MIVYIRTDKPDAELWLESDGSPTGALTHYTWRAHRELAETIHSKLMEALHQCNAGMDDITALIFRTGPGSFTGLRIGASVVQAIAWGVGITLVGASGDNWMAKGKQQVATGSQAILTLEYGAPIHTTVPKK